MEADAERRAIERVLAEYCHHCDDGRFDDLVSLFTEAGTFAFGRRETTGRSDLLAYYVEMQSPERRGKHLATNVVIDVGQGGDRAVARSDYTFLVRRPEGIVPLAAGRYTDELMKVDGVWRIHRRTSTNL